MHVEQSGREPSGLAQALALLGLFAGGCLTGAGLAGWLAPDSVLASAVSVFMLPLGLTLGLAAWLGLAILSLPLLLLRRLAGRGKPAPPGAAPAGRPVPAPLQVPPGTSAFVACCLLLALVAGSVTGALASGRSFLAVLALYTVTGLLYGLLCRRLARSGHLPFPDEV
jgi:hypothetical protein